jgi:hypothetical protein
MQSSELLSTPTDYATSLIASTLLSSTTANQQLENESMYYLIRTDAAQNVASHVTGSVYANTTTAFGCVAHPFSCAELDCCEISTTPGLHDGSVVVSTYHNQASVTTNDSQTLNYGTATCEHIKNFTVDEPTNSIHDSHLQITSTPNDGAFSLEDSTDTAFEATFTNGGTNQEMHKLLNSKYGNTSKLNRLYVKEDSVFNTTKALGIIKDKYFSLNITDGTRTENDLPTLNKTQSNGINVVSTGVAAIGINQCGTYRIQQHPDNTEIVVSKNGSAIQDSGVNEIPIHTKNTLGSVNTTLTRLPVDSLTPPQFRSMFDRTQEVILPEYTFDVEIARNSDNKSGIGFNSDTDVKGNDLISFDDRYLVENPYFIKEFASETGKLIFQPASVTLNYSSNGTQPNIDNTSFSLDTGREQLLMAEHDKNGEIILNKANELERTTIISNDAGANLSPAIYYENEYDSFISDANKLNHYVDYKAQVVFKNAINDVNFIQHNKSALNLISGNLVVNDNFSPSDWQITSSNPLPNTNEVWKIVPKVRLDAVEALKDSTGTAVPSVLSSAFMQNISVPLDQGSFNAKAVIELRSVSELSFYNEFIDNGWDLTSLNNGSTLTKLEASSTVAFAPENSSCFPDPDQMYDLVGDVGGHLPFKVRFNPGISSQITSSLASDFSDRVEITWGPENNLKILKIPQNQIERINYSSFITNTVVNSTSYDLTGYLSGKNVQITQYTSVKNFRIKFNLGLRSYSTLTATSPMYQVTSVYYIGKDITTNEILPSGLLSFAVAKSPSQIDFTKINEEVTSTTQLFVESYIEYDDVKEFNVQIQIQNGPGDWSQMSESVCVSSFYSTNPTFFNLLNGFDSDTDTVDISIFIQYQYMNNNAEEISVLYNDQNGYYMDLNNDSNASNFDLYSWSSTVSQTGVNSLIAENDLFISPTNGFSSIQSNWDTSTYKLEVSYTGSNDSTTVLQIKKVSNNSIVHAVTIINNKTIGTPVYISSSPDIDTWRIVKTIGNNLATATSTESFMSTYYSDSQDNINKFEIEQGVQLISDPLDLANSPAGGQTIHFSLLSDKVGVNLIGPVTNQLNRITWTSSSTITTSNAISGDGLHFRFHGSQSSYSKSFILEYYRGYLGAINVNQTYIITREVTKMTVKWTKSSGTPLTYEQRDIVSHFKTVPESYNNGDTLTSGLNNAKWVSLMQPRDGAGNVVNNETFFQDIGLLLKPKYSMLTDTESREYVIYTKGDSVVITISNPNNTLGTTAYPITISKTLKDYLLYNFSGSNYNTTGEHLNLYSTKLKSDDNMKYTLSLTAGRMSIYKDDNYLGNPVSKGNVNPLVDTLSSNWGPSNSVPANWGTEIAGNSYRTNLSGLTIPGYSIKRNPNENYIEAVTFFVLHAPMHIFNTVVYSKCPTNIPIDETINDSLVEGQLYCKKYSLPVTDKLSGDSGPKYNPFTGSRTFTYIDGTSSSAATNDNSKINDVMFYHKVSRVASEFDLNPISTIRPFNITGSNIIINLFSKLKGEANPSLLVTLYNGIASGLLSLDSNSNLTGTTSLRLSNKVLSETGAQISFLQSGIPTFSVPSETVFGISNITNVTFTVPNFFLGTVTTPIKLDLPTGPGTVLNMYTRSIQKDINGGATKIVLYKYIPMTTLVDWNNSTLSENAVINAIFDCRFYKTFNLPPRTLQQTSIQTFDQLLNLISKSDIAAATWHDDTTFNKQVRFTFSSFNIDCLQTTLPKFMSPPNNLGHAKFNIVTRTKTLQVNDKFGFPLADIDHDGIMRVNTVSTGCVLLHNIDSSNPTTLDKVNQRPVITFRRGEYI